MNKIVPTSKEYIPSARVMISEMNLDGIITFANRSFCEASGYEFSEIVGKSHTIFKHPNMPKTVCDKMWLTLQNSLSWSAIVVNIRKDGRYYWSETEIIPIYDKNERIKSYMSAKRVASRKNIQEAQELYKEMLKI